MLVKKQWSSDERRGILEVPVYEYTGYFLFGLIPVYISRYSNFR